MDAGVGAFSNSGKYIVTRSNLMEMQFMKATVPRRVMSRVRSQGAAPATIAGNVAALLLDVDTHKLPNAVAAPQLPEGCSKADRLAVNAQDRSVQDHQRCSPAQLVPLGICSDRPSDAFFLMLQYRVTVLAANTIL